MRAEVTIYPQARQYWFLFFTCHVLGEENTVKGLNPFVPSVGQIWPEEYDELRSHYLPPGRAILVPLLRLSCVRWGNRVKGLNPFYPEKVRFGLKSIMSSEVTIYPQAGQYWFLFFTCHVLGEENQRGLKYAEKMPLSRLCKMFNPFYPWVPSHSVSKMGSSSSAMLLLH
jgi:hypothetical protein